MKKLFFLFLFIAMVLNTSCVVKLPETENRPSIRNVPMQARSANQPLKRVFVLPFTDTTQKPYSNTLKENSRRAFVAELVRTGEVVVIKNSDFPKDFETFRVGNEYDLSKIAQIAQGMGVNAIIEGQVIEIKAQKIGDAVGIIKRIKAEVEAKVRIRAVSTDSQREIFNEVRAAKIDATTTRFAENSYLPSDLEEDPGLSNQVVEKVIQTMIPTLVSSLRKLSWAGRIAMVRGEKIYINAGRLSGIQVGDLMKVTDQGQDIFDPVTGSFIGRAQGRMKGTLEIVSYFGEDGAVGVLHSGTDFRENDKVELY